MVAVALIDVESDTAGENEATTEMRVREVKGDHEATGEHVLSTRAVTLMAPLWGGALPPMGP